ncbi:calmodulin-binding transcription activator 4-like, partial [Trifolium medium]|nr:calmodulin-binding transcription activator 4-like [Trifolium medium]
MLQGTSNSGPATQLSPFSQSRSYTTQNPETTSIVDDSCEPNQNFSSPGSLEVTSDVVIMNNGMDHLEKTNAQAFRQLEE